MLKPLDDKRSEELQAELKDARWHALLHCGMYYGFHLRWIVHVSGPTRYGVVEYRNNKEQKFSFSAELVDHILRQIPVWGLTRH